MQDEPIFCAGVDWASEAHVACLMEAGGRVLGKRSFAHGGEGLAEMCAWLVATSGAEPGAIHVAIETPHGPVVETLLERGFNVYAVNPKQLDRFRDRFSPAGAKDDSRDALVLADGLRTDCHRMRPLDLADPILIELREWSRIADELTAERLRLTNRIRDQLWRYFPAWLELAEDLSAEWFLDLWQRLPTPAHAERLSETTLAKLIKRHRIRRFDAANALATLTKPPLKLAKGSTEAATAHIRTLIPRLSLLNRQLKQTERELDRLLDRLAEPLDDAPGQEPEQRDVTILRSLPGVGRIVCATLLAEASDALRERDYHALRALSGVAPVTRRSGKRMIVVRRYACQRRLNNALYHWARGAIQHDPRSRAKYASLRQRGHSHPRALRSVADRLLAVACAMLTNRTLFHHATTAEKFAC
jgi:transposase